MREIGIDDVLVYRGNAFGTEKGRNQLIIRVVMDGSFFTKFMDNGYLNIINPRSGYYEECDIIPKEKHKLSLENGIPMVWDDEN